MRLLTAHLGSIRIRSGRLVMQSSSVAHAAATIVIASIMWAL
jgi:hypothetical protein